MTDCTSRTHGAQLRECPFCGGEAETVGDDCMEWIAECIECCASSMAFPTEAEAIAAWNARAERTCEYVIEDNMNESEGMGDVWFRCSNCGTCYDYEVDDWLMRMPYCQHCVCRIRE